MSLLTKGEVASYLKVSSRTVDRLRNAGKIRAIKVAGVIRFDFGDVENYVNRSREKR